MNQQNTLGDNNLTFNICKELINKDDFIKEYHLIYKLGVLIDLLLISDEKIKDDIIESLKSTLEELYINDGIINRLIQSAFLFSSLKLNGLESEETIEEIDNIKNKAYRISISLYYYSKLYRNSNKYDLDIKNLFNNNEIIYSLFTKLGILSEIRNNGIEDIDIYELDLKDKISFSTKEVNNSFSISEYLGIELNDRKYYLSDFQKETLNNILLPGKSTILSAPTSAGKTFIIKKFIITKLIEASLKGEKINIGFILPTKALVNEIRLDFIRLLKDYGIDDDINLHIHLSGREFIEKQYFNKSNLFILTQERLNYFYTDLKYNFDYNIHFHFIAVDEAHKISYGYRGTLLSYIINEIISDNKLSQICFLAPLLKKLSKIKDNFNINSLNFKFSNFGLVSKNLIYVKNKSRFGWNFYLKINEEELYLFSYTKEKKLSQPNYLAIFSNLFTNGDTSSLIYRKDPSDTVEQAKKIKKLLKNEDNNDLGYLKDYINDTLSEKFELVEYLEKGVGFHNGRLPIAIKKEIEKIYKKTNIIKYLCVNSTVLEGVNLPAKNIFIGHSIKDTETYKMSKLDIKNLIGRAGRLNNHMNGNIFFIESNLYEEKISGEDNITEDFKGNVEKLILDSTKFNRFLEYLDGNNYKEPVKNRNDAQERRDFEYMTGYLLSMYIKYGDIKFISEIKKLIYSDYKDEDINKLRLKINIIYKDRLNNVQFNKNLEKILIKNIFVDPRRQIDLYENLFNENDSIFVELVNKYSNIVNLIKGSGEKEDKKEILSEIVNNAENSFIYLFEGRFGNYIPDNGIIKGIINQWISEISLKDILGSYRSNTLEILKLINNEVLFNYLNAISIYLDIFTIVFEDRKENLIINDFNLPNKIDIDFTPYLETGAYQPYTTYLISKGIDRETALYLKDNKIYKNAGLKRHKKVHKFFKINKEKLLGYLEKKGKILIKQELEDYIY